MLNRISVRVADKTLETREIVVLTLEPADGGNLPRHTSGAHVDLYLPNGFARQYSLFDAPGSGHAYRVAVKKEPASRGGSVFLYDQLDIDDVLEISAPKNNFGLVTSSAHVILLAGGIGITPLLSMAHHLSEHGRSFELHYFSRSPNEAAFHQVIEASDFACHSAFHFGLSPGDVADRLETILDGYEDGKHVYVCGPTPFIAKSVEIARRGWSVDAVHLEYFTADVPELSAGGDSFVVHLAQTDRTFTIPPDKTIAEVLIESGVPVEVSCEQGVCGNCLTKVLDGLPQHHDVYLSDEEHQRNDQMTICVSRCQGKRIVLDR